MKHIGWCLEKIQMAFGDMPKELSSDDSRKKAKKVIDDVQKYADTLVDLIHHHKFEKTINRLEGMHIENIQLQTNQVKELFKDLEHALYIIDLTLKELREIVDTQILNEDDIQRWKRAYDKLVFMIDQKFGGDRGELSKEFKVVLHTKEELEEIINCEEHLAEFLK
jgi:hypothetical protein